MNEDFEILMATLLGFDTVNATDFGIETADLNKIGVRPARPHIVLQQTDLPNGAWSCFYTAPFRCAADAYVLNAQERIRAVQAWKDGWNKLCADGKFVPGVGGRMADGVDYARRAWNAAFPNKLVRSYRGEFPNVSMYSTPAEQAFYRAIFSGWMLTVGRYSSDYIMGDLLDDGIIQGDAEPEGEGVFGHLTCGFEHMDVNSLNVLDNYPKWKTLADGREWKNAYVMDNIRTKRTNEQIFPSAYFLLPA